MNIPPGIIDIIVTVALAIVSALVTVSFLMGRQKQELKSLREDINRVESNIAEIKYENIKRNDAMQDNNKVVYELKGMMETYIKMYCNKKEEE